MPLPTSLTVYSPSSHLSSPFRPKAQSLASAALSRSLKTNLFPPSPPASPKSPSFSPWSETRREVAVPEESRLELDTSIADLAAEPRAHFEVTTKLFLPLPYSSAESSIESSEGGTGTEKLLEDVLEKLSKLLGEEAGKKPDTFVVSWGGVLYEGEETDYGFGLGSKSSTEKGKEDAQGRIDGSMEGGGPGCGSMKLAGKARKEAEDDKAFRETHGGIGRESVESMVKDWTVSCHSYPFHSTELASLVSPSFPHVPYHPVLSVQTISSSPSLSSSMLGVAHFPQALLANFLDVFPSSSDSASARAPTINHLTLKDCCHIPQELSDFARERGVTLMSSDDPAGKLVLALAPLVSMYWAGLSNRLILYLNSRKCPRSVPISVEDLESLLSPYASTLSLPESKPRLAWLLKVRRTGALTPSATIFY
jgi:hypothetical protein